MDINNNKLKDYGDIKQTDIWTEWYTGDTFKIQLTTNGDNQGYGFLIDDKETRTYTPNPTFTGIPTEIPVSTYIPDQGHTKSIPTSSTPSHTPPPKSASVLLEKRQMF